MPSLRRLFGMLENDVAEVGRVYIEGSVVVTVAKGPRT